VVSVTTFSRLGLDNVITYLIIKLIIAVYYIILILKLKNIIII